MLANHLLNAINFKRLLCEMFDNYGFDELYLVTSLWSIINIYLKEVKMSYVPEDDIIETVKGA